MKVGEVTLILGIGSHGSTEPSVTLSRAVLSATGQNANSVSQEGIAAPTRTPSSNFQGLRFCCDLSDKSGSKDRQALCLALEKTEAQRQNPIHPRPPS